MPQRWESAGRIDPTAFPPARPGEAPTARGFLWGIASKKKSAGLLVFIIKMYS